MRKIFLFIFCINPLVSFAQGTAEIDSNLEDISGMYAECAAYYTLVYHSMISANEQDTAEAYGELQENALNYSLLLASQGRSLDMATEVTTSRFEMYTKAMNIEADNKAENISILINKYHFGCQDAMENPPSDVIRLLNSNN